MSANSPLDRARPRRRGLVGCSRRRGTTAVEYALIAMLVSCGAGFFVVEFGPPVNRTLAYISSALSLPGPLAIQGPGAGPASSATGPGGLPGGPPSSGGAGGGLPAGAGGTSTSTI